MSQIENGQNARTSSTTSAYVLPHRIEFHLSKKSSLSFNGSSFNPQIPLVSESSGPLHSNVETDVYPDVKSQMIVRRIGAGLENLRNTCFLNSVLQCLTYTEPLVAYLQSGKHQNSCRVVGFCALCSVQKHVTHALQATGRVLAPKDLVSNLRCISRNFRNARQEDAHEYMVHLLESMHKCCLPPGVPSESSSAYEKSFVHKIFGGSLKSQVKCMQCSYSSNKFDPFLDLSLEIVKADSLQKALTHFTAQEQLDSGERRYQCQQCKQKVQALKQLTIEKAPDVLTIHLKRFGSHVSGQKIDKKVQFGPILNLKPFVSESYDGELKYTLYGVLVHAGWSTHSGHYYCFVRTSSGMWYSLDDSRVVQVSERTVMEQKAYMLFYLRDAISKHKIVPTPTQNGSYSISSVSQRLENRSTAKPASVILDKAIPTAMEIGTGFTGKTVLRSSEGPTDVAEKTVPSSSDKAESSPEEPVAEKKPYVKSSLSKSNRGLVSTDGSTSNAISSSSCQKLKRKVLAYRVASTHLSTRLMYEASLNLQKRKKHKKVKRCNQQFAATNIVDEQMGPSTSHVTSDIAAHSSSSPKKESKCRVRKTGANDATTDVTITGISIAESCGSELKNQIASGDAMPIGDDQSLKSTKMPVTLKHQQDRQPSRFIGKINVDDGIAAARWDALELESSQTVDPQKHNTNTVSIGYVPDEWDEEYDRGKRKKVRTSTISFGGPNPFQEIATMAVNSNDRRKRYNLANQGHEWENRKPDQ